MGKEWRPFAPLSVAAGCIAIPVGVRHERTDKIRLPTGSNAATVATSVSVICEDYSERSSPTEKHRRFPLVPWNCLVCSPSSRNKWGFGAPVSSAMPELKKATTGNDEKSG